MEMPKGKELLALRRDLLMHEVEEAFGDVVLGKGMSWYDSIRADMSGTVPTVTLGLKGEEPWQELTEYAGWDTSSFQGGGFAFLDAEGFRFYIAPTLMRMLQFGYCDMVFFLTLSAPASRDGKFAQWEALDVYQRLCIKHVLEYMADITGFEEEWSDELMRFTTGGPTSRNKREEFLRALKSYWGNLEEVELPRKKSLNRHARAGKHWHPAL